MALAEVEGFEGVGRQATYLIRLWKGVEKPEAREMSSVRGFPRQIRCGPPGVQRPGNPLSKYLRITGATVCLLISFSLQYAESNHSASPLGPLLVLQRPQHRATFHIFGCLTE